MIARGSSGSVLSGLTQAAGYAPFHCVLVALVTARRTDLGEGRRSSTGGPLAQALALEFDPVRVVDDPIEDGVGQRRVADDLIPAVDRQLTGDNQRAGVVAILDDLQQIALLSSE